jgi:hypothetical protein
MANPEKKINIHDLTSIIISAHSVSFLMENTLAGIKNSDIWPFSSNGSSDEDFEAASIVCGGSNEPSVLTAWSVGLTVS